MKKKLLLIFFITSNFMMYSQRKITNDYELYLLNMISNEMNISKEMKMTDSKQCYYEGKIEVTFMNNGDEKSFDFFFSSWDNKYKEFKIRDKSYQTLQPVLVFDDENKAFIKENQKNTFELDDNSSIENAILSAMVVWLNNTKK